MREPKKYKLEADLEKDFVNFAAWERGVMSLKMEIVGSRNWPDQMVYIGDSRVFFIEFKLPGEVPRRGQLARHKKLRARGYSVYVCDTLQQAIDALDSELLLV